MGFQYFPTFEAVRAAVDAMYMTTIKSHFSRQLIKRWRGRLDFVDLVMKMSGNNLEGAMYCIPSKQNLEMTPKCRQRSRTKSTRA